MIDPKLQPVADAIRAGNTFEAIRLLREATGMSFDEAQDAVEKLTRDESATGGAAPVSSDARAGGTTTGGIIASGSDLGAELGRDLSALRSPRDPATPRLQGPLADEVAALALENKYLDAIKLVRARNGVDLKTAKDQVEMIMEDRGIAKPGNKGCLIVLMAVIVVIGAVLFVLVR